MAGLLYVSMLAGDGRHPGGDGESVLHAYAVAVSERYRKEARGALAQCFPDLVNTVVGNVFIVTTAMAVEHFRAAVAACVARHRIPIEVLLVDDLNWVEISRSLRLPAAVA